MPYPPLSLAACDMRVNAAISMFSEPCLEQAHYLQTIPWGRDSCNQTFGLSAAVMLVVALASVSTISTYNPSTGKNRDRDALSFKNFVRSYFPFSTVKIEDDQHRSVNDRREAFTRGLYDDFRCPLFHNAGVSGTAMPRLRISMNFPGLSPDEVDADLVSYLSDSGLREEVLAELGYGFLHINVRTLYRTCRCAIETASRDPAFEKAILDGGIVK